MPAIGGTGKLRRRRSVPDDASFLRERWPGWQEELFDLLRIPSISTVPSTAREVLRAASYVASLAVRAGILNARVEKTDGHPVVVGSRIDDPHAPVVLVYGHYDVQPSDPVERWTSPPFEPTVRGGRLFARGASDDKAPLFTALKALEALVALHGTLPVGVRLLLEGEEELGSPSLGPYVQDHSEELQADVVISADGAMWKPDEPCLTVGLRGLAALELTVRTAKSDLHSGRHGGGVPNALHVLAKLVASLHEEGGRIAVRGFYDDVRDPSPEERREIRRLDFDEADYQRIHHIVGLTGEAGFSTLEREWLRPTLDVNGLWGGYEGEGSKTVIPAEARAKISCRLVPEQDPERIAALVRSHLERHAPKWSEVQVTVLPSRAHPYRIPDDHPILALAEGALVGVTGRRPERVWMGATVPAAEVFERALGAHTLFFSFSTTSDLVHAPNESFSLDRFHLGARAWMSLLRELSGAGAAALRGRGL